MITLDVKDVRKDYLFIVRVYGKELLKVNNKEKLKGVVKALHCLGVEDKFIHCYKVNIRKVDINV